MKKIFFLILLLVFILLIPGVKAIDEKVIPKKDWSVIAEGFIIKNFYDDQNNLWLVSRKAEVPDTYYLSKYDGQNLREQIYFPAARVSWDEGGLKWQTTADSDFALDQQGSFWVYSHDADNATKIYQWQQNHWEVFDDKKVPLNYNWQGANLEIIRQGESVGSLPFKEIKGFYFDKDNNMWLAGTGEIKNEICPTSAITRGCEDGKNWELAIIGKYNGSNWQFFTEMDWNYPENLLDDMPDPNSKWNLYSINDQYYFWVKDNKGYIKISVGRGSNKQVVLDFSTGNFILSDQEQKNETSAWSIWEKDDSSLSEEELKAQLAEPDYATMYAELTIFPGLNYFDGTASTKYQLEDFTASEFDNAILKADDQTVYFVNSDLSYEASFPPAMDGMKDFMLIQQYYEDPTLGNLKSLDPATQNNFYQYFGGKEEFERRLAKIIESKTYYNPDHYGEIRYTKIVKVNVGEIVSQASAVEENLNVTNTPIEAKSSFFDFLNKNYFGLSLYFIIGGAVGLVIIIIILVLLIKKFLKPKESIITQSNVNVVKDSVAEYIVKARNKGMTDENIKAELYKSGWLDKDIKDYFN